MFLFFMNKYLRKFLVFSGAYSNTVFPAPLSKEEEEKELDLMFSGSKVAREKLIEHNLRLVAHIVKKYENNQETVDDLISIGTIGLIKGIDSLSKDKGIKLTTYIARCIENEILMFYRSDKKNKKNVSLNEFVGFDKDDNEITLIDILKTPKPDFAMDLHKKDSIENLKKYFKILTPKEKEIIIKRYGLNNEDAITQKEIAKAMGISRSYVSRIEKRSLTKILREFLKEKK